MELWYSVFEFMSNRLAEKRTNFFGIPSSSKPIILQRSRLSIRIVLHSSSHLLLLFYFFFFVRVCKAITPSLQLRFILCCIPRKLERDHQAKFWAYPLLHTNLFFVCCIYCAWLKWKACQILLISFCSSFSRALGNTLYSTFSPLIEKLCIEECCEIVQKVSLLHFRGNSLSRGHVFLRVQESTFHFSLGGRENKKSFVFLFKKDFWPRRSS